MILTAVIIYFLIGLFLAGLWEAFDNETSISILIIFCWPIVLCFLAIIVAVVMPYAIGIWIGDRVKGWF